MIRGLFAAVRGTHARAVVTRAAASPRCLSEAAAAAHAQVLQTRVAHPVPGADAAGANQKFAVIAFSGKQFKCVEDDLLICDRQEIDIGTEIVIDDVLLVGTQAQTIVGRPKVQGASVRAVCEQHPQDKKTIVFKKLRRKGYRRTNGFRRQLTALRVVEINDGTTVS
jgi:large subunit ribosomal protein L21